MKTLLINSQDIPDWEYGDVVINKMRFGDKLELGKLTNGATEATLNELALRGDVDATKIALTMLSTCTTNVKKKDSSEYIIKDNDTAKIKQDFFYNIDENSAKYLLTKIAELNQGVDQLEKKD